MSFPLLRGLLDASLLLIYTSIKANPLPREAVEGWARLTLAGAFNISCAFCCDWGLESNGQQSSGKIQIQGAATPDA